MISSTDIDRITGSKAVDRDGDKIGTVDQVYVDAETGGSLFVAVTTGLFGTSQSFVPLEGATLDDDGVLRLAYDKATVKGAPNIAADGDLDDAEQDRIFDYYGAGSTAGTGTDRDADRDRDRDRTGVTGGGIDSGRGRDTSGPTTDDAMTRSEERLHVGTQRVETGRARLRKHVVTEQRTERVPVTHEEARLEREPITDANAGAALDGPALSEEEHEVVLTAEEPVVSKETVPVERVRLGTETVRDERTVTEDVRKEQIDVDGDGRPASR